MRFWQLVGDSGDLWGSLGACGLREPASGGLQGLLRASSDALSCLLSFVFFPHAHRLSILTCFPIQLSQVPKGPKVLERHTVF